MNREYVRTCPAFTTFPQSSSRQLFIDTFKGCVLGGMDQQKWRITEWSQHQRVGTMSAYKVMNKYLLLVNHRLLNYCPCAVSFLWILLFGVWINFLGIHADK